FLARPIFQCAQLVDEREHVIAIACKRFAIHIDFRLNGGQGYLSRSFPRKRESSSWPSAGSPLSRGRAERESLTPAPSASSRDESRRMLASCRATAACCSTSRSALRRRCECMSRR